MQIKILLAIALITSSVVDSKLATIGGYKFEDYYYANIATNQFGNVDDFVKM